jgi:hypothetical protein
VNRLKRCAAAVTCLFSLVLAGCGVDATGVVGGSYPVSVAAKQTGADVCLVGPNGIEVVHRAGAGINPARSMPLGEPADADDTDDPVATLLDLLVAGPTEQERARGLWTEVSTDTRLVIEDPTSLVDALSSVPLDDVELVEPLSVTVASSLVPTETAAEQIGCTLERYLARSGIIAQVILYGASDEVVPRAGIAGGDDQVDQPWMRPSELDSLAR